MRNLRIAALGFGVLLATACGDDKDDNLSCDDTCVAGATCMITTVPPSCVCPAGLIGDGTKAGSGCTTNAHVDECAANTDTCVALATCTDTTDGFTCSCTQGYDGDGTASGTGCSDIDECAGGVDDCVDGLATCSNSDGAFTCACAAGYSGDGTTGGSGCTNIDECTANTDDCVETLATCADTAGAFTCTCAEGYTGDGRTSGTGCVDIDECTANTDSCDAYALCVNTVGSFACQGFYAASPFQNRFYRLQNIPVSPATVPAWTALSSGMMTIPDGPAITGCNGFANDPTNGDLYAILKVTGVSGRQLGKLDPTTGVVGIVGNLGDNFASIAFRDDGQLFGVTGDGATVSETLYLIDKADATKVLARALGAGNDGEVIQFNPVDGLLYHWSGGSVVFESITTEAPYDITSIPISGASASETFGAFWDNADNTFVVFNIASRAQRVSTSGVFQAAEGSSFPDDLRSPGFGPVVPHRVEPAVGAAAGGETITLHGVGFGNLGASPTVTFGGVTAASVTVVDDTHLSVVTPAAVASGPVDVHTDNGSFVYNWPAGFSYE